MSHFLEKIIQILNQYKLQYIIDSKDLKKKNLFCFTMEQNEKFHKEEKQRIEIYISTEPEFYEIKVFDIENYDGETQRENLVGGIKMEDFLDIDEFNKDLKEAIENKDKFFIFIDNQMYRKF